MISTCGAVILAAGEARRFGSPKLLMPFGSSTVLGSVVDTLVSIGIIPVVVVGSNAVAIQEALDGREARIARNPNPDAGMISSVRVGVEALPGSLERFLIVLGDQPRIRAEDVPRLIREQIESGKGIAVPVYEGRRGHPILFSGAYRQEIVDLTDQQTLRDLMLAHQDDRLEVACDSDGYVCDIDTREEYEHELRRFHDEQ